MALTLHHIHKKMNEISLYSIVTMTTLT